MAPSTEQLIRDLEALRQETARLKCVEAELAAAMESLRGSEERLRLAVDAAQMGLWEWDMLSNRVNWDAKKYDVFGLAYGSFAGTKEAFFELVHPEDRSMLAMAITRAVEDGAPYHNEFRIVAPAGHTRWIANLGQVYRDDEGRPLRMIGVVYDVTDRKLTERALRDSEEKFRSIVETTSEWIWAIDRDARITYSNPAIERILGYHPEELAGLSLRSLVHEDDLPKTEQILSTSLAEKRAWAAFVVRCRHKDDTYRYLECHGVPILDATGEVVGFRGSDRDVTERKQVEEELRDAHRMEGIGQLAGGFAHHFNNLLTVIVGHVDMALELSGGEAAQADLQAIRQAAQRGALLTRQLLTFAGKQIIAPRVVNVNDLIDEMGTTLRRLIGEDIELVTQLSSGLWNVNTDPAQLDLVLMNLAVNAQEAMPNGGTLTIATANVAADDEYAPRGAEVMPGGYVMIAVSDTGTGMTEEIAQQIFEPFFTTKEWGSDSTGLGLSTCYGVVAQQGGHIRVLTEPDKGSTFRIYLPRLPIAEVTQEHADTPLARPRESMTVLVADDEAGVRKLASRILRTRGYSVLEAASGAEALVVARAWHGRIHLLVTDVVMPGMSGWELAKRLLDERPGIETLYISGHTENAVVQQGLVDQKVNFLQKPFAAGALVQKVRRLLDAAAD
ncbi:MAG TPA: PAS domain S-box protein [Candidatus Nitrosotalea sp.]|nr:PAS domain S-box protein [Candidatus Nitrosotalea sp.]